MTVTVVPMYDATHNGIASLPHGQAAGYTTGTASIAWSAADWAAHPGAVRICQDSGASDHTADILDVETGAATPAECPGWFQAALASYTAGTRPGQRYPAIYCNLSTLTAVAAVLTAAGSGVTPRLWLAEWSLSQAAAAALVTGAGGPWPVIAVQYSSLANYDVSAVSQQWLQAVSAAPDPAQAFPAPGGLAAGVASMSLPLSWHPVTLNGKLPDSYTVVAYGLDGNRYAAMTSPGTSCTLGGLKHGWTYKIRVWANGGQVSPPHAEITASV